MEANQEKVTSLRVNSSADPVALSTKIFSLLKEGMPKVEVMCVGASSVNQACKAVAIASGKCTTAGISVGNDISFFTPDIKGVGTGIKITVKVV